MWYSAHSEERVVISRATSLDGVNWQRQGTVLSPSLPWEKSAVMCPSVLRDDQGSYHMWYSGGERYEPDAIGYATSPDGITWAAAARDPVLRPGAPGSWEADRVAGAHVYYTMANGCTPSTSASPTALRTPRSGSLGRQMASRWERHDDNPVITRGAPGEFDSINVYKPFVVVDEACWRMWFNGSSPISGDDTSPDNRIEQIGYASCQFQFRTSPHETSV